MPDTSAVLTMRRTVLASTTKFCPQRFVGVRSSSAASARISLAPRSVSPLGLPSMRSLTAPSLC